MKEEKTKIAAIVVTYNRCGLLQECIKSLRNQTYRDFDIIVVNNGSEDETRPFIDSQSDIIAIHQENRGGAGGFYSGMKYAYDHGYQWLWLMDDDGYPEPNQLNNLLEGALKNKIEFANALVVDIKDPSMLSFGISEGDRYITESSEAKSYKIIHSINPFNGTFINRSVIDKIGYVKKEMFIYGDEQDFQFRALEAGIETITITNAIHKHPRIKGITKKAIPFLSRYSVNLKPKKFSHFFYRNRGYINQRYLNKFFKTNYAGKTYLIYIAYFLFHLKLTELFKFMKWYNKGRKGDFD